MRNKNMNIIIESLSHIDEAQHWHSLNNFTFTVKGGEVEIQAGDNYGNTVVTGIDIARKIYKHIKDNKIYSERHGLDTFKAVRILQDLVDKYGR